MTLMFVVGLAMAWLLGSVPTAYLVGRAHGVDLRTVGSGNLGATNALRTLGWKAGLLVYFVDTMKGVLPVALIPRLLPAMFAATPPPGWGMALGVAAILGHVKPVFLRGKGGGKGVATASGVFFALVPWPALGAMVSFILVTWIWRYISLASLVGSLVLVLGVFLQHGVQSPYFVLSSCVALFVFYTHRDNIGRLRSGTERRLGERTAPNGVMANGANANGANAAEGQP